MTLFLFRINLVELRLLVLRERLLVRKGLQKSECDAADVVAKVREALAALGV